MHELGVVIEVVKTVEEVVRKNGLTKVGTLVLQIGELSSMIPRYIEACFPAAVDGTLLENTELRIEILPGLGLCRPCGQVFNLLAHHQKCPACGGADWELRGGKEFLIKEILAC